MKFSRMLIYFSMNLDNNIVFSISQSLSKLVYKSLFYKTFVFYEAKDDESH